MAPLYADSNLGSRCPTERSQLRWHLGTSVTDLLRHDQQVRTVSHAYLVTNPSLRSEEETANEFSAWYAVSEGTYTFWLVYLIIADGKSSLPSSSSRVYTHRHETHDIYTQCSSPLAWVWHSAPAVVVELDSVSCAEAAVAVLSASSLPDSSTQWTSPPSWVWHS